MAEMKERLRAAALYFRYHRDNPHVGLRDAALAEHLVALAEWAAGEVGHDVTDPRFVSGRAEEPSERAPGRDDLPAREGEGAA